MKKIIFLLVLMLFSGLYARAEVVNEALGKNTTGTFSNPSAVVDNSLTSYASSGNINENPQFVTVDLGKEIYIGSLKIYWGDGALSHDYSVRVSKNKRNWFTEFSGLDAASGILDPSLGTISQVVSTRRYLFPVRYVQVYIPVSSEASASSVNIYEIQLFAAKNLKFSLENIDIFPIGDKRAIGFFKTSMVAVRGMILYGTNKNNLDQIAEYSELGILNSFVLSSVNPGTLYYCKIKAWDMSWNMVQSDVDYLNPLFVNLAKDKDVSGTFTALPPADFLVDRISPVSPRIVDGNFNFYGGMATSGSIKNNDQEVIIDLGENYETRSIISYWREIAYPESFNVSISNDRKNWQEIASRINAGEGALLRANDGDPIRVVNTETEGRRARYVRIFIPRKSPFYAKNEKWDFVQLMEIEVLSR